MIEHVFRGTRECELLDDVVIATCDTAIADAAAAFGARAVMTSAFHERASDRVAEAVALDSADLVVMVQGDEPMVRGEMIAEAIGPLAEDERVSCVNLAAPIRSAKELDDPNTIKLITDAAGNALHFSRRPIPDIAASFESRQHWKQVCVIAFRRSALEQFSRLEQGPQEKAESVDMLRFLEHGCAIRIAATSFVTHAVDTPEDLEYVSAAMSNRDVAVRR